MKDIAKTDEQKIIAALERAVKMANDGSTPDDALYKVASDGKMGAETVKRMVEAFNVSKTLSHLKKSAEDDRATSFPIASAEAILGQLFPAEPETPTKTAAAGLHPDFFSHQGESFAKSAKVEIPPMTEKKAEMQLSPAAASTKASKERSSLLRLQKQAKDSYRECYFKMWGTIDKAAEHWGLVGTHEPFELVEKRAYATYGPAAKYVMDLIEEHGHLDGKHIKRASADELGAQQMHFDIHTRPYADVADAILLAKTVTRLAKEAGAIEHTLHEHALNNYDALPPRPVHEAIEFFLDKEAAKTCPGGKIRSKGKGRGLGLGGGKGPMGIPIDEKEDDEGEEKEARDKSDRSRRIYKAIQRVKPPKKKKKKDDDEPIGRATAMKYGWEDKSKE